MFYIQVFTREDQVPVSLLRLHQKIGDLDLELRFRDPLVVLSGEDLVHLDSPPAVAQQVLPHRVCDPAGVGWVENIVVAVR